VDAVTAKPGSFVEPSLRRPRLGQRAGQLQDCALRRGTANGQLKEHWLAHVAISEPLDAGGDAKRVPGTAGRPGDHDTSGPRAANLVSELRTVDRVEPRAAEAEPTESQGDDGEEWAKTRGAASGGGGDQHRHRDEPSRRRNAFAAAVPEQRGEEYVRDVGARRSLTA
jgi:hypothetical protein